MTSQHTRLIIRVGRKTVMQLPAKSYVGHPMVLLYCVYDFLNLLHCVYDFLNLSVDIFHSPEM